MRALALLLLLSSPALAAPPEIAVEVPLRLAAWATASVKVVVRNRTGAPIVPTGIVLESDAGPLAAWGMDPRCQCSVEVRWASGAPARHRGRAWELLLGGPPPQQRMEPPDERSEEATEQLVRLDPIPAGATVELDVPFLAKYQHGGKLAATMRYVVVDPKALALCTAATPVKKAFVPCTPTRTLDGTIYAQHPDLVKAEKTITARATFAVEHPAFDLADARAKTKAKTGAFGYERKRQRWILIDGNDTIVVAADGTGEDLPGDWVEPLVALDSSETTTTYWNATAADARAVEQRLRAAHLSVTPFTFKGHTSADRFLVTFERDEVAVLAATMRALGYRMVDSSITK